MNGKTANNLWNDFDSGKSKWAKKEQFPAILFNKNLEWKVLGSNPNLQLERQANRSETHDTA